MDAIEEIKTLGTDLKSKLQIVEEKAAKGEKMGDELKAELSGMANKFKELADQAAKQQADLDKIGLVMARKGGGSADGGSAKSLFEFFYGKLEGAHKGAGVLAAIKSKDGIDLNTKAVGDLSTAGNVTGTLFTLPYVLPGVVTPPIEEHIRAYMRTGPTSSPLVRFAEMLRGEGGFGMVAEGGLKPQMDYDLTVKDAPARKIAGHVRVPEEMLEDIGFLAMMLSVIAMEDLKLKEDEQILYGSGTGENLRGISVAASSFAPPAAFKVADPNLYDVIKAIRLQIRKLKFRPDTAFVSPTEWTVLTTTKDANNRYLFDNLMQNGTPTIDGVRLIENVAVEDDDIFVGDFSGSAFLLDRQGASIRSYDQDRDNAIRNLVTFVIEERVALPILRPQAFVYTQFSTAQTVIAKP